MPSATHTKAGTKDSRPQLLPTLIADTRPAPDRLNSNVRTRGLTSRLRHPGGLLNCIATEPLRPEHPGHAITARNGSMPLMAIRIEGPCPSSRTTRSLHIPQPLSESPSGSDTACSEHHCCTCTRPCRFPVVTAHDTNASHPPVDVRAHACNKPGVVPVRDKPPLRTRSDTFPPKSFGAMMSRPRSMITRRGGSITWYEGPPTEPREANFRHLNG